MKEKFKIQNAKFKMQKATGYLVCSFCILNFEL